MYPLPHKEPPILYFLEEPEFTGWAIQAINKCINGDSQNVGDMLHKAISPIIENPNVLSTIQTHYIIGIAADLYKNGIPLGDETYNIFHRYPLSYLSYYCFCKGMEYRDTNFNALVSRMELVRDNINDFVHLLKHVNNYDSWEMDDEFAKMDIEKMIISDLSEISKNRKLENFELSYIRNAINNDFYPKNQDIISQEGDMCHKTIYDFLDDYFIKRNKINALFYF